MRRIAIAVPLLSLAAACGGKADAPAQKEKQAPATASSMGGRPVALPSGREVTVHAVAPIRFTQGPPALRVLYVTTLDVGDTTALAQEATEVFERFRSVAEREQLTGFVASATAPPSGMVPQTARGYNFVWTRGGDGKWHRS
ncbi:MAG TPA: hypothetical protein VF771_07560 [Longimicrobiaceae bacterium]